MKTIFATVLSTILMSPVLAQNQGGNGQGQNGNGQGYHGAPGPIAGAGLPFVAVGLVVYWFVRRRYRQD